MMTPKQIRNFSQQLEAAGSGNPTRSVEELAGHVLGCKPLEIYFRQISPEQCGRLEALVSRAASGEPIQYIIGHVDFRGLEIQCDPRALIPRPETEWLVEAVLSSIGNRPSIIDIADVCTGTGCIGLALAHELPNAHVTAIDISAEALSLARENGKRLGLSERVRFLENDLLQGVEANRFDIVVSNPPYILSGDCERLDRSVKEYEPMQALDGGGDGLDIIRPLAGQSGRVLKPGGRLFLEIGCGQSEAVCRCLEKSGLRDLRVLKDLAGHDRIVSAMSREEHTR